MACSHLYMGAVGILILGIVIGGLVVLRWHRARVPGAVPDSCAIRTCEPVQSDVVLQLNQARKVIEQYVWATYGTIPTLTSADLQAWATHATTCFISAPYRTIGLLYECVGSACKLFRCRDGHWFRDLLEKQLADYLCQLMKQQSANMVTPVTYVSLGSGGLYQDFCVCQQVLACYPRGQLALVFIDPEYRWYAGLRAQLGLGALVSGEPVALSKDAVQRYAGQYHLQDDDKKLMREEDITDPAVFRRGMQGMIWLVHERFKQLCSVLAQQFPHARIQMYVYADANAYLGDVQAGHAPCAQFVGGLDAYPAREDFYRVVADRFRSGERVANLLVHSKDTEFVVYYTRLVPVGDAVPPGYTVWDEAGKTADYTVCGKRFDFFVGGDGDALFAQEWRQRSW